ncbi:MAG: hypothetical protein KAT68_04815, partial [Bacteroidales bacterium]|nr:hypothetical protein [Bacteroidales bacterium]
MKKKLTYVFRILLLFIFLSNSLLSNGKTKVLLNDDAKSKTEINLINSKTSSEVIEFIVNSYFIDEVKTPNGPANIISLDDGSKILLKGAPDLPKLTTSIIIPDEEKMQVKVLFSDFIEIENIEIAPSKGILYRDIDPATVPYTYGNEYNNNEFFPGKISELRTPYIVRNYRGQTIVVYPFQYNPVSKTLRIYTNITVEVFSTGKKGENIFIRNKSQKGITSEFNNIYSHHFLNYDNQKYTPIEESENMLIISTAEYMSAMTDFVNWKISRGLNVEIVDFATIGTTADEIKTYVVNYYNTNGLSFLLLIGDGDDIPSLYKSGDSDAAYGHITGDDSYAELFVGRFSANSVADVETQVARSITYERDLTTSDTWIENGLGIASDEGGPGQGDDDESDIEHLDNIRTDLLDHGYVSVDQIYDPGATSSEVATSVNGGISVINYTGHGSVTSWSTSGFSVTDVNSLTNENQLPYIFDVACVNGAFHGNTCFAESWLRATNSGNPTGAIAICAGSINQSWAPPMDGQDEMVDILVDSYETNIKRTYGGIVVNGCMHMNDEYAAAGDPMTDTWTIFGDPSILVRTTTPAAMSINHDADIFIGAIEFTVNCDANDAVVALVVDGELIGTGIVTSGSATVNFDALSDVGTMNVTITGRDKVTYLANVNIIPASGAYLTTTGFVVNDPTGNNNNLADFGENIVLDISVKNVGADIAYGVTSNIVTTDEYITITDNAYDYGDIAVDATVSGSDFAITIANNVPDQHVSNITLNLSDNTKETWVKTVNLTINAPALSIGEMLVDDSGTGNNDGILDPGETANIVIKTANVGHADVTNAVGVLTISGGTSPYLTINTASSTLGILYANGDTLLATFSVTADAGTSPGTPVDLVYTVTAGVANQYTADENKQVIIGEIPIYLISDEGTHAVHTGLFYDSGGESGNYEDYEDYTITFTPAIADYYIKLNFLSFNTEQCCDHLYIYDGTTTGATLIGKYNSGNPPSEIIATNDDGAITCYFHSDYSVDRDGWEAEISLEPPKFDVTFSVTDGTDPILEAEVEFGETNQSTDIDGLTIFTEIPIGNDLPYIVAKYGFSQVTGTVNVIDTDVIENIVMVALPSYDVTFVVTDGTDPIEGAEITTIIDSVKTTDINGQAIFYPINGDYTYTVT